MIQETPQAERFKQQLRDSLRKETQDSRAIKIAKHDHVYTCGDRAETIHFVESGQVELLMLSPEGKECLLAIYTAGDIFGELRLPGVDARLETATTMEETTLKQIHGSSFFARLRRDLLFEGFVQFYTPGLSGTLLYELMNKEPCYENAARLSGVSRHLLELPPCALVRGQALGLSPARPVDHLRHAA